MRSRTGKHNGEIFHPNKKQVALLVLLTSQVLLGRI